MELHGHKPNKRAGQNFLVNRHTAEKFVNSATHPGLTKGATVVEIGPGLGAVTRLLCERFAQVVAIEKDARLVRLWRSELSPPPNLTLVQGDAATYDYARLAKETHGRLLVFGNLPFNVSTLILQRLFATWHHMAYAHLTFQKEVADRLLAAPGSREYGSLTILRSVYTDVEAKLLLRKGEYYPVPKVDSRVLGFTFLPQTRVAAADLKAFEALVRQLFLFRRKTLLNGLRQSKRLRGQATAARDFLQGRGLPVALRAEQLDLDQLYAMFLFLKERGGDEQNARLAS